MADDVFILNSHREKFDYYSDSLQIFIGDPFNQNKKMGFLAFKTGDSLISLEIKVFFEHQWKTVFNEELQLMKNQAFRDSLFYFKDMTGDKIPELLLLSAQWDIHPGQSYYCWTFEKEKLERIIDFEKIASPIFDPLIQNICSYQANGCSDYNMIFESYQIKNNRSTLVKSVNCNCCDFLPKGCEIDLNDSLPRFVPSEEISNYVPSIYKDFVDQKMNRVLNDE